MHMAWPISFTLPVVELLIVTSYCSAEKVHCVTPNATTCSSCPPNTHCATLSEYAHETEMYFTSNTTIVFLPGDHVLDRNITVVNVARLTMRGESSSESITTVVRNGPVGFNLSNMVDFNMYSLAFTSSNRSWGYGPASSFALFLQSTQNSKLVNCSFHDNLGSAIIVHNTSVTLAENSEFVYNQCACESFSEKCELGCGVTALKSNLTFTGNTTFLKNRHNNVGVFKVGAGAIFAVSSSLLFTGTNNFFDNVKSTNKMDEQAHGGGATYVTNNSVLNFHGTNNFINNTANYTGGAIYASHNTILTFTGTSNFISNYVYTDSAHCDGGAIYTHRNAVLTFNGTNNFTDNLAHFGGAVYAGTKTLLTFIGTSVFSDNSAYLLGGAIYVDINIVLTFNGTNNFINNLAYGAFSTGGAIGTSGFGNAMLIFNGTNNFTGNSAYYYGGVIYAGSNTSLTFIGTTGFRNNSANHDGGAIYAKNKTLLKFTGISDFITNKANIASSGGAISICDYVVITFTGTINFISNSAMQGGAISVNHNIKLTFDGNISFTNNGHDSTNADNEVSQGGAIYLTLNSTFSILPHTTVCWENNHATLGGAIYVSDVNPLIYCSQIAPYIAAYVPREECFFQLPGQNLSNDLDAQLIFKNNFADAAGSVLYGGAIDNCKLRVTGLDLHYSSGDVFDMLFRYEADTGYSTTSKISSDPLHMCVCNNNLLDCRSWYSYIQYPVHPGETFQLSLPTLTVGQRDGTVSSTVRSTAITYIDSHSVNLLDYQYLQHTNNTCTKLNYTVFHWLGK